MKVIEGKIINPFKTTNQTDLLNISTGAKADSMELIYVREKGIAALKTAEESGLDRIIPPSISCFKDKKFSKHNKQQTVTQIYKDELAVTRALCFFHQAGESLRDEAFSHEWTDYPSSLFKPDARFEMGFSMVKGQKSGFPAGLLAEIEINMLENLPGSSLPTSYLIDAMSFIQRYRHLGARTFGNLVECYMMQLLRNVPPGCMWIHVVGDQYDFPSQKSLKEDGRVIRKNMTGPQFDPAENIMLPEWKSFISNSHNKENLLNFFLADSM